MGHVDDFTALQQQVLEGKALVHKMKGSLLDLDLGEVSAKVICSAISPNTLKSFVFTLGIHMP